jgi:small-conductance mechanosensitive channel
MLELILTRWRERQLIAWGKALPVVALLAALATPAVALAAAPAGPAAAVAPALPQKVPPAPGVEQKAQAAPVPVSIPIPEITTQAEKVAKLLGDLEALAAPGPSIDAIQAGLPEVSARLGPELASTIETIEHDPTLTTLDRLTQSWQASRLDLAGKVEVLTGRATQLENALDRLSGLRATWTRTRADAQASRVPAAVVRRVDSSLADIEAMRARLQAQRNAILVLQDRVAQEAARCEDALARIDRFRQGALGQLFVRDTLPIWSAEVGQRDVGELPARVRDALALNVAQLRQFIGAYPARLLFHGLLFIGLVLLAHAARRRARGPAAAAEGGLPAAFDRPYSGAAAVALVVAHWIYPDRSRVVGDVIGVLLLLSALRIVRPLVGPGGARTLYALMALCFADRVRSELAVVPLADQALLLLEMLAAMAGLAWLFGFGRLGRAPAGEWSAPERLRAMRVAAGIALGACAASFVTAAYGNVSFARLLGPGLLGSAFIAVVLYATLRVTDGLMVFALLLWPLRLLGMVDRHRALLERRAHRLLCWVAGGIWAGATLNYLGLLGSAVALGQAMLAAELRRGTIGISLGDVLAFVLTVWLAFLVSAFLQFVLEEDVYPRLRLARGLPYMISTLLHYAILFLGFLLAVAALGVDLNKVTILAGAFGVGIGFGLQNVVNNFVSGLIVLVERPIREGDVIQVGDIAGEVRRIGIRSSTLRTPEGADVIIPNASVVSEKVTNWTYSDRLRRLDVRVNVAYGSAPEKVIELLGGVAAAHPGVLAEPPPLALFLGFGESALNFELRAWTNRFDRRVMILSDLGVAVYAALRAAGMEIPVPQREVRLRQE